MWQKLTKSVLSTARPLAAASFGWLFLAAAVNLGLRVPGLERVNELPNLRKLDYGQVFAQTFRPLASSFISRVLGLGPDTEITGRSLGGDRQRGAAFAGEARLVVNHPFNNDDFGSAYSVDSIPFTARTRTQNATRQADEPTGCSPTNSGTVWYQYRAGGAGPLVATTFGSDHSTALAVFLGNDLGDLKLVGCDFDAIGASQVVFGAGAQQTYFFQVTAPAGGGSLVFNLDPLGLTERASMSSSGREGNGGSFAVSLSEDGRYVAFHSAAQNLVEGDTNSCPPYSGCFDIFVHDRLTKKTDRVSVSSSNGDQSNHASVAPTISGDGRYVAFTSFASNLVPNDSNGEWDVFVHDRVTRVTELVSVDSQERQGGYSRDLPIQSSEPSMMVPPISLSHDGRYVAFASDFSNLVPSDTNACFSTGNVDWWAGVFHPEPSARVPVEAVGYSCRDVFVRDRMLGTTTRVSVASDGTQADGDSSSAFISPNGRYVAFSSDAENLDPRDRNLRRDAFVHDRHTRKTELVSISSSGEQGDSNSGGFNERGDISISDDGRFVSFISHASNFAPDDTIDQDVFVRDRQTGQTILARGTFAEEAGDRSTVLFAQGVHAAMSADGRFIASTYHIVTVRPGETRHVNHVLVFDRLAGRSTLVSVSTAGEEANDFSMLPDISANGRVVGFHSYASNLTGGDNNRAEDVFIHEMPWAR
jgi:Tol biopolymer transport system component